MLTHEFSITEVPGAGVVEEPPGAPRGPGTCSRRGARAQEARSQQEDGQLCSSLATLTRGVQLESLVLETQGCVQGVSVGGLSLEAQLRSAFHLCQVPSQAFSGGLSPSRASWASGWTEPTSWPTPSSWVQLGRWLDRSGLCSFQEPETLLMFSRRFSLSHSQ